MEKEKKAEIAKSSKTCRTCEHLQRWECGGSIIQYCSVNKSSRTLDGLKKIKVTMPACGRWKGGEE